MQPISPFAEVNATPENTGPAMRDSARFRFCSGRCQGDRPPEGGVELAPGRWRCSSCWMEMARKRGG